MFDLARAIPHLGPAVGPGAVAVQPVQAQNLDAAMYLEYNPSVIILVNEMSKPCVFKAPNKLNLISERPDPSEMVRFRESQRLGAIHRAAARLWAHGVSMASAMSIVREAVAETV